jgi:acetylornithine/succinyldiaminopimelate/putrescine aminotransferase
MQTTTTPTLSQREHKSFIPTYKRLPIEADRAEGMYIIARDGRRYLDFLGGIAVNSLGHSHPKIIAAVEQQLRRYTHLSNFFYQEPQIEFVERLSAASSYPKAFLSNSGTEAIDGAIKLVRAWGSANGGRSEVIGFTGGFHGRTYGALSITNKAPHKDGMGPFLPSAGVLPFNDVDTLRNSLSDATCAVFVEFLQGEGGINWITPEFATALAELKQKHGFLVVADEIQSGAGRTGDFFAFNRFDFKPDVITLAKGIGGGLPLGAILATDEMAAVWGSGQHGTTFGGNALACVAGSVVIDEVQNGLMDHVREVGDYMLGELNSIKADFPDTVKDVRGAGAMLGMELTTAGGPVVEAMLERDVIINATSDTVLRFLPPFIFEPTHVDEVVAKLREVLQGM